MRSVPIVAFLVLIGLQTAFSARQRPQDVALQAAMRTETVVGDLRRAIREYGQIVTTYGKTDRPIAARALLRMADCYQKLGGAEARKTYERLVREFPEQQDEVAAARARLAPGRAAEDRVVWSGEDVPSEVALSPDGKYLAWCAEATPDVMIRTVATGAARALTSTGSWEKSEFCGSMAFSRDGRQLAYTWTIGGANGKVQIRVVPATSPGLPEPQVFGEYPSQGYLELFDWTPDGRIVAQHARTRLHEIVVLGRGGAREVVKSLGPRGAWRVRVSPDGRRIVFDAPASEQTVQHDVFVIGIDGSSEARVSVGLAHEVVSGWSPDGGRVLFMSDAGGTTSHLMSVRVDAQAQRRPELLVRNLRGDTLGITSSGSAFVYAFTAEQAIHTASVELSTGTLLREPTVAVPEFWSRSRRPKWSRDGKQFAALASSRSNGSGPPILLVHANEQMRSVPLKLTGLWTYDWSPDGRSFLARATDLDGRHGLYHIDAQTGETAPVLLNNPPAHPQMEEFTSAAAVDRVAYFMPQWSPNAGKFFYNRGGPTAGMYERDLATGQERQVFTPQTLRTHDGKPFPGMRDQIVSPDGRYVAGFSVRPETVLWVVTLADLSVREVFRVKRRNGLVGNDAFVWTPDSTALVVNVQPPGFGTPAYTGYGHELWAVSIQDRKPVRLDVGTTVRPTAIAIHPDGRQIAFVAGGWATGEIRILNNLLPPRAPK